MDRKPVAFLSYSTFDDKHDGGRLTTFRERLEGEIRVQAGLEFDIFQDRLDIALGQDWKERILKSLDEALFLIPVISPGFFRSSFCRDELERFAEREKQLNRNDLIFPVYYIDCPLLNDAARRASDPLADLIASRQYADWRELRHDPFTTPQVGKMLAQLAVQIRDALDRAPVTPPKTKAKPKTTSPRNVIAPDASATAKEIQGTESVASDSPPKGPSAKTEPPTLVVDALHRGDYATISDAIKAAKPGTRILIRPGLYQEGIVMGKPLELIGEGELGEVVVQAKGSNALLFMTTMGRVSNLVLRQAGGGEWHAVDIAQGRLDLEDCDITSQFHVCIGVHGGADPRIRRCRIHDSKYAGIYAYENGLGTIEDNDISGNGLNGIEILTGSNPAVRKNRIHDNKATGIHASENGLGTIEDNDISGNGISGIEIKTAGSPAVRKNRIHNNKETGVYVHQNGLGTIEDNDIFENRLQGIEVGEAGNPMVRNNRINDNVWFGIRVNKQGGGTFEDNDLTGNKTGAISVEEDCKPNVKLARNKET